MANLPWPVLNIRCTCMVQKPPHIEWYTLSGYRASTMSHQMIRLPPTLLQEYRQPSPPLYGSITFTHLEENSGMVNFHTYVKKLKGKPVWPRNHHMQNKLFLNQMCKIGLTSLVNNKNILTDSYHSKILYPGKWLCDFISCNFCTYRT